MAEFCLDKSSVLFLISVHIFLLGVFANGGDSDCGGGGQVNWLLSSHTPQMDGVVKLYTKGYGGRLECVYAEVEHGDLDKGTAITQAMKDHVRLQDANNLSDKAAQIVARKLGGPGNVTFNVFPQNGKREYTLWNSRAQQIYDDLKTSCDDSMTSDNVYKLTYRFQYDSQSARPKRPTGWTWRIVTPNGTILFDKFLNPVS